MVSNGLVNTVGVNLIHRPIIRFIFSGRRITLFTPARLVDSWSSQAVEFSVAITRCSRVHIQIVTVWASKMGDIFSLPLQAPWGHFSNISLYFSRFTWAIVWTISMLIKISSSHNLFSWFSYLFLGFQLWLLRLPSAFFSLLATFSY